MRTFWLTLFAIGAAALLVFGWRDGEPWTAAAFVVFFVSRVWRSVIKRPLGHAGRTFHPSTGSGCPERVEGQARHAADNPARRVHEFIAVTAAGYLGAGICAAVAAAVGEGPEWIYVAPCFIVMGLLNLYIARHTG